MSVNILNTYDASERVRVLLTFSDGRTFSVEVPNYGTSTDAQNSLISLRVDAEDSITSGNPVGVLSPSNCNIEIYSKDDVLNPFNTASPYSGFLIQGVKLELFRWFENPTGAWRPYGTFFADSWTSTKSNGAFGITSISGTDMLDFLGNQPIPDLSNYTGVSVRGLLNTIFSQLRDTLGFNFTWNMSDDLDLDMIYALAKGDRVRDVLNSIAQALLARIFVDRDNVIQIQPAVETTVSDESILGVLETDGLASFDVELNNTSMYNKVRLQYTKAGSAESSEIASTERAIGPGSNTVNIEISNTVILIDGVYIECEASDTINLGSFTDLSYNAMTGMLEVVIVNNTDVTFNGKIVVQGIVAGDEQLYAEASVPEYTGLQLSTLELSSYIIQTEQEANTYVSSVANYLSRMKGSANIAGKLSPSISIGKYIKIEDSDAKVAGTYLVTSFSITFSIDYDVTLRVVKIV